MNHSGHHLIFEGAELTGKSFLISQVYDLLETKYNKTKTLLDGCHWFNSDIGIFGTKYGKSVIEKFIEILNILKNQNVIFEKFHISDIVYNRMYHHVDVSYRKIEDILKKMNVKIILCTIKDDPLLIEKRLNDRIRLYPHYKRIAKSPQWYLQQQKEYIKEIHKTKLPYLMVDITQIPNEKYKDVLQWIGEI